MAYVYTDTLGAKWNFVEARSASGTSWEGSLQSPAYGTTPGAVVIRASTMEFLKQEANDYAADYLKSGNASPQLQVTARAFPWWLLVVLGLAYVADRKGKR